MNDYYDTDFISITVTPLKDCIPIKIEPSVVAYEDIYRIIGRYNEVKIGEKCWLPEEFKDEIREELVEGNGYYNSKWHGILSNYRIDESFIREILDYIGLDFLKQYQHLSTDFARELENNPFVRL